MMSSLRVAAMRARSSSTAVERLHAYIRTHAHAHAHAHAMHMHMHTRMHMHMHRWSSTAVEHPLVDPRAASVWRMT